MSNACAPRPRGATQPPLVTHFRASPFLQKGRSLSRLPLMSPPDTPLSTPPSSPIPYDQEVSLSGPKAGFCDLGSSWLNNMGLVGHPGNDCGQGDIAMTSDQLNVASHPGMASTKDHKVSIVRQQQYVTPVANSAARPGVSQPPTSNLASTRVNPLFEEVEGGVSSPLGSDTLPSRRLKAGDQQQGAKLLSPQKNGSGGGANQPARAHRLAQSSLVEQQVQATPSAGRWRGMDLCHAEPGPNVGVTMPPAAHAECPGLRLNAVLAELESLDREIGEIVLSTIKCHPRDECRVLSLFSPSVLPMPSPLRRTHGGLKGAPPSTAHHRPQA